MRSFTTLRMLIDRASFLRGSSARTDARSNVLAAALIAKAFHATLPARGGSIACRACRRGPRAAYRRRCADSRTKLSGFARRRNRLAEKRRVAQTLAEG